MERLKAARTNALGVEVTTFPLMAARLAGGFKRPAAAEELQPAIRHALQAGDFKELEGVRGLPGMVRAVQRTLTAAWRADLILDPGLGARMADLARLDRQVRAGLPGGVLAPQDLRAAALERLSHAASLLGSVELVGLVDVDPVWRPLVLALTERMRVVWTPPCAGDRRWFTGTLREPPEAARVTREAVICADPRAEVVEALRWARGLMASGVRAVDIAIASAACEPWDEAMLVLAHDAKLPVHFSHGHAALEGPAGQACAALADILLRGLSQMRVRRLLRRSERASEGLPSDWTRGLRRAAGLFSPAHWRVALVATRKDPSKVTVVEKILLPRIEALAQGISAAAELGEQFLDKPALALWRQALRAAPAEALEISLQTLRVTDGRSPGANIVWAPAAHLAGAPRPHVRLLGLTSRAWPRSTSEDPLLPDHIISRNLLEPVPRPELDVRLFEALCAQAKGNLVLSRSRRSAEGAMLAPSRLFPEDEAVVLTKVRTPIHAFNEADRLLARPLEAREQPALALGRAAWAAWLSFRSTPWDGRFAPDDPSVRDALGREQSATSLRRLLRDPLGFVWQYALCWWPVEVYIDILALDRPGFGDLVHELLRRTTHRLNSSYGVGRASPEEIEAAAAAAANEVATRWPAERPTPPPVLWRRTVDEAVRLAVAGLCFDQGIMDGTRSWSEVAFGRAELEQARADLPWDNAADVILGGLTVGGRIDRLDLRGDGVAARVTDYKTGALPRTTSAGALAGGSELQRVIYSAAAMRRLSEVRQVVSRLVYLRDGPSAQTLSGDELDGALGEADRFVAAAAGMLLNGSAPVGPDAYEPYNDLRLALPADLESYRRRKVQALEVAAGELSVLWGST
ncbi:PD-(D/E)XK nuclease family protein [Mesorhizobium sp. M2A.F.Ca.ET.046.03.2.1]|uniref:PD-(D/E)XK nuclease family protein n=1 Tax=Mesorhizobium sp. M2A.F.Ca.ET.046.03.2.1 TaxID=2493674 RepID=UPI001676D322|nr:PD-(D/E)XK nuclease family protein [Mesorhizobium sp. M2A.F.Ca.ET.046.03.2.1]